MKYVVKRGETDGKVAFIINPEEKPNNLLIELPFVVFISEISENIRQLKSTNDITEYIRHKINSRFNDQLVLLKIDQKASELMVSVLLGTS